jgi:SH3 domain-containing YSC84-like protein 1
MRLAHRSRRTKCTLNGLMMPMSHTIRLRPGLRAVAGLCLTTIALLPSSGRSLGAPDKYADRARRAGEVLAELTAVPDHAPPVALLHGASCIAVVPGVVAAGLGVGGEVGFGLASCRTPVGWSLPMFMGLKGGSFGLQIGGQSTDVVLVFVNENAPDKIVRSTLDLGGEASVAAGPVGRDLAAATDYRAQAEIYSYSKAKGLFAGLTLTGTKWEIDAEANRAVYGDTGVFAAASASRMAARLIDAPADHAPAAVRPFLESLMAHVDRGVKD